MSKRDPASIPHKVSVVERRPSLSRRRGKGSSLAPTKNRGSSKRKGGPPTPIPVETERRPKRVNVIASPGTFGSHNQTDLVSVVQRDLEMEDSIHIPSLTEYGDEEEPQGGLNNHNLAALPWEEL